MDTYNPRLNSAMQQPYGGINIEKKRTSCQ